MPDSTENHKGWAANPDQPLLFFLINKKGINLLIRIIKYYYVHELYYLRVKFVS